MNVSIDDGHLSLHLWDLRESDKADSVQAVPEGKDPTKIGSFHPDAQIAAAYANRAGYRVSFAMPGFSCDVEPDGRYLPVRRVTYYFWKPVAYECAMIVGVCKAKTFREALQKLSPEDQACVYMSQGIALHMSRKLFEKPSE